MSPITPTAPASSPALPSPDPGVVSASGSLAWDAHRAAIMAAPNLPEVLPPLDLGQIALNILGLADFAAPHRQAVLARFSDAEQAPLVAFFDNGKTWASALFFVYANYINTPSPEHALKSLDAENLVLRPKAFAGLSLLESAGVVERGTVRALEKGRGRQDAAADLATFGALLTKHWPTLAALYAVRAPANPLTQQDVLRCAPLSEAISEQLNALKKREDRQATPWRAETIACAYALQTAYEPWQLALSFHFKRLQQHQNAALFRVFGALQRP